MNKIKFIIKNGAYEQETVNRGIVNILSQHIGIEEMGSVESAVMALDASHFYLPSGAKMLKPIRGIIGRVLGKNATDSVMQSVSGSIAALYSPAYELEATFADINSIGQYGDSSSCFLDGGCNSINRVFLKKNHRVRLLVIKKTNDPDSSARCFVYFPGGREIRLFNFYYNGITQNSRLFTEAIRRLMCADKVKVVEIEREAMGLPVYVNTGAVSVFFSRSFTYNAPRIFVCPHCDAAMPEADMKADIEDNSYFIGCSHECINTDRHYVYCSHCNKGLSEDAAYSDDNGEAYCEECYNNRYTHCQECDTQVYTNEICSDGLCEACYHDKYTSCERCGYDVEITDAVTINGVDYHDTCAEKEFYICAEKEFYICSDCGDYITSGDEAEKDDDWFCPDCYEKVPA